MMGYQVNELHRLYRVQKLMMSNMETRKPRRQEQEMRWKTRKQNEEQIDESEIQLTLGPSVYKTSSHNRHQKRPNSGQSLTSEDFGWSFGHSTKNVGEEHLRQDRMEKHPPWLFQALSFKLT